MYSRKYCIGLTLFLFITKQRALFYFFFSSSAVIYKTLPRNPRSYITSNDRRIVQKRCLRRRSDLTFTPNVRGESSRKARSFTTRRRRPAISAEALFSHAAVSREIKGSKSLSLFTYLRFLLFFFLFFLDSLYCVVCKDRVRGMVFEHVENTAGSD